MLSHFAPHKYKAQSAKAFSLALFPGFPLPREHGSGHLRFVVTDVPPQPNSQHADVCELKPYRRALKRGDMPL